MISATIAGSLFAFALDRVFGNAVTGITTVGALPSHLPPLSLPDLSPDTIRQVAPIALANTILALTLAIGVGRSLGLRSGQRIDNNQEFIGQGISNIAGASSRRFRRPARSTAAPPTTMPARRRRWRPSSRRSSWSRSCSSSRRSCAYLPYASMAAILFLIAYGLVDLRRMRAIRDTSRTESAVMFVTLIAALFLASRPRSMRASCCR